MKIRRDIASIPVRSAQETWSAIVDLISSRKSVDRQQLLACAPDLASIITDELPARVPIVVKGSGHRLVIYCVYGDAAVDLGTVVDPLSWNPTEGSEWRITAPAEAADVAWLQEALGRIAPRITVHDVDVPPEEEPEDAARGATLHIKWDEVT
jgi:hypothetical protein